MYASTGGVPCECSVYLPGDPGGITGAYWDVASCLEPLLPTEGTLGIMGLGGGTAAVVRTLVSSL